MSWLMKTAAIELRVTSLNRQRSHTQRLVSLLLDDQPHTQHTGRLPLILICSKACRYSDKYEKEITPKILMNFSYQVH